MTVPIKAGRSPVELEAAAIRCLQGGDSKGAEVLWRKLLEIAPSNGVALTQLGQEAFKRNATDEALALFQRAAAADPGRLRAWLNLALAAEREGARELQAQALQRALALDAYDLTALFLRARLREAELEFGRAAADYAAVIQIASQQQNLAPELQGAVARARAFLNKYRDSQALHLDAALAAVMAEAGPAACSRFRDSLDIFLGRKRRFDSQPMRYYFPRLPSIEFFDRASFPWLDAVEGATSDIRAEFECLLTGGREGFAPYIQYGSDEPVAQWRELNHNPAWSAFHLVKDGAAVAANAERCPRTMAVWRTTPSPEQPGRTPVLLFSALQPRTHIPAHVGASNCRVLVHLPLIVPRGCRFRVGNQVREWEAGRCLVFDDTIEHEAWNDSEELRVVLIFDTWHPMLTPEEQRLITAMNVAMNTFAGTPAAGYGS
jgi:aspartate beta-hydroxylase